MINFDELKLGMKLQTRTYNNLWLPCEIIDISHPLCDLEIVWVSIRYSSGITSIVMRNIRELQNVQNNGVEQN